MRVETVLCSSCTWWRAAHEAHAAHACPPHVGTVSLGCSSARRAGGFAWRRRGGGYQSAVPHGCVATSSAPEPRGKPFASAADVLADACADVGVRFELTDPEEAYLWDDDYLDVVADAEDGWGREAAAVPEQDEARDDEGAAPVTSAYASDTFSSVSVGQLLLSLAGSQPPAVLDVRDNAAGSIVLAAALRGRGEVVVVHAPLAQLKEALAGGRLEDARRAPGGIVCVSHTPDLAAQAQVRLARVYNIPRVSALGGTADELIAALR